MHIQEASSTDELPQIQGESVFRIFKTILHSLYPHIIFSNTENIDRSLPIAGNSPTAGNKRQDSHSHRMYVCSSYNYAEEKKYQSLSTPYSSRVGSWHSLLHCRTLASAKLENLCLFQALLVFLDEVSIPSQAAHILCCEGLCTQLVDHVDCQDSWNVNFPCSVRIPMTRYIPHHLCMQGLVNPSTWNSPVELSFSLSISISALLLTLRNSEPWDGRQICVRNNTA